MKAAILVVSDGVWAGSRLDEAGPVLAAVLGEHGFEVVETSVVADEQVQIEASLRRLVDVARLVVTTGGTGLGPRDVTPEATKAVVEREAPGLVQLMLGRGIEKTPFAALSRGTVGSVGATLLINLPGSPSGATENLQAVIGVIPHALRLLEGDTEHRGSTT